MPGAVRFLRAELHYGCHAGRAFELGAAGAPAVILGPNGSGKSTLLEALVRALFGFNRRQQAERARLEHRRPWGAEACRVAVVIADRDGARWRLDRSFDDARVRLERLDPPGGVWEGEANPAAENEDAREYRRRLRRIIGFADIESYVSSACIQQGALRTTQPGDHLLRLATGGHRDVERAREKVKQAHRELTARAIAPGAASGHRARQLEALEEQVLAARDALRRAESAERRRGPLLAERAAAARRSGALEAEIDLLEAAQGPLAERRALDAERAGARARLDALERAAHALDDALDEYDDAAGAWHEWSAGPLYPADFPERLAKLEALWRQRMVVEPLREEREAALQTMRRPVLATAAAVVLLAVAAAGGALVAAGAVGLGLAAMAAGGLGGAAALLARQRAAERHDAARLQLDALRDELARVDAQVAELVHGVPEADTLAPATAPDRRGRFVRQRAAEQRARAAAERLRAATAEAAAAAQDDAADVERAGGSPDDVARHLLARLLAAAAAARRRLAELSVKLEQADAAAVRLPDGVAADHDAILRALAERRGELRALEARTRELDRMLLEAATGTESAVAIADRLHALEAERAEVEAAAQAHAAAFALLGDADAEFRARDQERLVRLISSRLTDLTRARLGPLEVADGSLAGARLHAFGRVVPLESPPLSYGERHAAALAVRLGAADFLAANGVEPPLLVDEPFAYLDPARAAHVWELLARIAERRQVIIATQDRLVLEHLAVEAEVLLG